jgi:signal transduction histidine kinase
MEAKRDDDQKLLTEMNGCRQADEVLLKADALQRAIFNSANFSSIATDAHGVIQIFNVGAERMLGYTAAEVINKVTPADISDAQEVIARAEALSLECGTTITPGFEALVFKASRGIEDIYELTYCRKDNSRFPAVVSVTALRDAQDAIIGYLLIGTDNTARKQAEEALLRSEMLANAGRMAASIAHEINNPLEAIMNTLYLLRTVTGVPVEALDYLDIADGELMRIAHIARQTLGFYREFSAATSNSASDLIGSVVNLLQAKIRANGATVEQRCEETLQVIGIAGELRQVLANLLANSLDAIGQNGRIVLRAPLLPLIRSMGHGASESQWPTVEAAWRWQRRKISSTLSLPPRVRSEPVLGSGCVSNLLKKITAPLEFGLRQKDGGEERRFPSCSRDTAGAAIASV